MDQLYFTASTRSNITVMPHALCWSITESENRAIAQYTIPPAMHAVPYISLRNMSGSSLMKMSRSTPPSAPVVVPMNIATHMGKPKSSVFCMPITTNSASPTVSKINTV